MPQITSTQRIFVAGASSFLGTSIVFALLTEGVDVTAMVPSGTTWQPPSRYTNIRVIEADAWNRGSLTGRSRGHNTVIHVIGSIRQLPGRGLTYHYLNVDSLQNIARMAISDGVSRLIFISAAGAPWLPQTYLTSKREAEQYLRRCGIGWTVVRAPLIFPRANIPAPLIMLNRLVGAIPLLGRPVARWSPLPVNLFAQGIVQIARDKETRSKTLYGWDILRYARAGKRSQRVAVAPQVAPSDETASENDPPFGWLP